MSKYTIYTHLLSVFDQKILTQEDSKRVCILSSLFILSEGIEIFDNLHKIDQIETEIKDPDLKVFTVSKYLEKLFFLSQDHTACVPSGLINRLFFYFHLLVQNNPLLKNDREEIDSIYLKLKEKIDQVKIDLFIMKKRLDPYHKIEPVFPAKEFCNFLKKNLKKLISLSLPCIESLMEDESILFCLLQKRENLSKIFEKKAFDKLFLFKLSDGGTQIRDYILEQYQKRGFLEFIDKNKDLFEKNVCK